jgi:hypothetical protein
MKIVLYLIYFNQADFERYRNLSKIANFNSSTILTLIF